MAEENIIAGRTWHRLKGRYHRYFKNTAEDEPSPQFLKEPSFSTAFSSTGAYALEEETNIDELDMSETFCEYGKEGGGDEEEATNYQTVDMIETFCEYGNKY
ncbi:uncharacterized protein LOC124453891 [Xenia sp. Carnegie-2017]|uniref:uncharacterized protein LOC124453891 n=1 Tax=Xenia sp. Carnegie-2017 TaxID=2897299 RepID=UPI001F045CD4|nr:uncharacterized protein LOC124453891 [Xenia sp. Carnegie-2017]